MAKPYGKALGREVIEFAEKYDGYFFVLIIISQYFETPNIKIWGFFFTLVILPLIFKHSYKDLI